MADLENLAKHHTHNPFHGCVTPEKSEIATRLIAEVSGTDALPTAANVAAALAGASANLSRYLGNTGCHALLSRALRDATKVHSTLAGIAINESSPVAFVRIAETIKTHGDSEAAAGLQHLLVVIIELLGRLIGDQLAMKLLERPNGH